MAIDSSSLIGVQTIRVNRYDNTGADIAGNIKYARTIRVDHNGTVRGYEIKSVALDPTDSSVYYIQVRADRTSQPGSGTGFTVALAPGANLDLDYHEYNALLGNADENVYARNKFKIKHDTLKGIPDNIDNILNKSEELAEVKDDMYSDTGLSNARYKGSKNTSTDINVYQAGDTAGFKSPAVEVTQDYYAYFNYIGGTSPELPNKVAADIKYLIGADGTVIDPKTDDDAISFIKENFQAGDSVIIELDDPKAFGNEMSALRGEFEIIDGGNAVIPITNTHFAALPDYLVTSKVHKYLLPSTHYVVYEHKDTQERKLRRVTNFTMVDGEQWITGSYFLKNQDGSTNLYSSGSDSKYVQIGLAGPTGTEIPANPPTLGDNLKAWITDFPEELVEGEDYVQDIEIDAISGLDLVLTDATGYNTIIDFHEIKPYDYILFQHQTIPNYRVRYQILEVVLDWSGTGSIKLKLDRAITDAEVYNNAYSIIRYKDTPTSVILNTNKPPGATSGGILKPKYVSEKAEESIKEALYDLRGKGMI